MIAQQHPVALIAMYKVVIAEGTAECRRYIANSDADMGCLSQKALAAAETECSASSVWCCSICLAGEGTVQDEGGGGSLSEEGGRVQD